MQDERPPGGVPAGVVPTAVALVSVSVIAFQIVIMQKLSVMQWHHFAYMVISMAMLGFGAAGTLLSLVREAFERRYSVVLPTLLLLTGASMAAAARIASGVANFDTYLLFFDPAQIVLLILSYLIFSLPFFSAGLAITLAFMCEVRRVDRLYFANLLGSGLGAVLILALLSAVPLEYLGPLLGLFPIAAAVIARPPFVVRVGVARMATGAAILVLVASLLIVLTGFLFPVSLPTSQYKDISAALQLPDARVVHRTDGPHGRVEVVRSPAQRIAVGQSLHYRQEPPVRDVMFVNGDYYGTLLGYDPAADEHLLDATTQALPYALRSAERVLVMNAATGTAVSHALARDARRVAAVEPNRQANALLRDIHPEWIDGLFLDSRVALHDESPRTYLSREQQAQYDLIVTPVLGAFGGETGVGSLTERYDLTREAFELMWRRLAPDGLVATTVWVDSPARSLPRVLATWRTVLDEFGVDDGVDEPLRHIAAVRSWATVTVAVSRSPFSSAEIASLRRFSHELGFDPLLMPGITRAERERYNVLADSSLFDLVDAVAAGDLEAVDRSYLFDVLPVSDDRPYFSRFLRLATLPEVADVYGTTTVPYLELGTVLAGVTLVQIVAAAILLVVAPLSRVGWKANRRGWTLLTFAGLGIGFMFFEIVLIQHLVLYLGQPVYATAAVLAVLLVASGTGSLLSRRYTAIPGVMSRVGALCAIVLAVYAVGLMPVVRSTVAWPLAAKLPIVLVLLSAPALLMGMMFPLGLNTLARSDRSHIPWACAIDSAFSVSATAIATIVSIGGGYRLVLALAAGAYLLAALGAGRLDGRPGPSRDEPHA